MSGKGIPNHLQIWVEARERFHLSHAQIQMARELGLNPKRLGKLANTNQEPWKIPLPQFIERLYRKRFKRPKKYDEAVNLLLDLRDVAADKGEMEEFRDRLDALREAQGKKPSLLERLGKAGL
jgi:hypothetical protein